MQIKIENLKVGELFTVCNSWLDSTLVFTGKTNLIGEYQAIAYDDLSIDVYLAAGTTVYRI